MSDDMQVSVASTGVAQFDEVALLLADGQPMRVRFHGQIYDPDSKSYQSWREVSWRLEITPASGGAFIEALQMFFKTLGTVGPEVVTAALQDLRQG